MHSLENYLQSKLLVSSTVLVPLRQDCGISDGRGRSDRPGDNNLTRHVELLAEKRRGGRTCDVRQRCNCSPHEA
jgi:hypothetical protein